MHLAYWSIAQTKNRETEASGMGWELFKNYLIALEKYKPDYFLYENNKSMSAAIRAQITEELGMEPILINSALVSAQSRQRLYWVGKRNPDGTYSQVEMELPEDRGILLRDILESEIPMREKGYTLKANYSRASAVNALDGGHFPAPMAIEPVNVTADGKAQCLRATYYKDGIRNMVGNTIDRKTCVAEAVSVNRLGGLYSQHTRWGVFDVGGKVPCLTASAGMGGGHIPMFPIRVGTIESGTGSEGQGHRVYSADGNSKTRRGRAMREKANCLTTSCQYYQYCGTLDRPIYEVRNGQITIKGQQYPIKLMDGYYIIRKLTVRECMRLQTVPEGFVFPVSDTQAYKMLGNGWTVDVIAHIMSHFEGISDERVEVLSMYDGMSCGHIALDKLGANVTKYYATEIDKYAIKTTMENYPNTIQLGDAFQVREEGWEPWA